MRSDDIVSAEAYRPAWLASLFSPQVATVTSEGADGSGLHVEEAWLAMRMSPCRRAEFAAARTCARSALARLGAPQTSIGRRPSGAPLWPSGFVGSISHSGDVCAAAVAQSDRVASLGLDVEMIGVVGRDVWTEVFTPRERALLSASPAVGAVAAIIFAAKEAVFKALHPLLGTWLDFHDCEITARGRRFVGRVRHTSGTLNGVWIAGRYIAASGFAAAGVELQAASMKRSIGIHDGA